MSQSSLSWRNEEVTINAKHHLHVLFEPNLRGGGVGEVGKWGGRQGVCVEGGWQWASVGWWQEAADGVAPDKSVSRQIKVMEIKQSWNQHLTKEMIKIQKRAINQNNIRKYRQHDGKILFKIKASACVEMW